MLGLIQSTTSWISLHYMFALKVKDSVFQIALRGITPIEGVGNFAGGIFLSSGGDLRNNFDYSNLSQSLKQDTANLSRKCQ